MRPRFTLVLVLILRAAPASSQQAQNPSPMVEHTRPHPRLIRPATPIRGYRDKLATGALFIPEKLARKKQLPLFIHFHGGSVAGGTAWIPEMAAVKLKMAVITIDSGSGSGTYARQFTDRSLFAKILEEAQQKSRLTFSSVTLTAWSAGHGAIREILTVPEYYAQVSKVILIDGLHTGYDGGKPGPLESKLEPDHLEIFLKFAQDAAAGRKAMRITHSEIFPGTFASTTETADWLLAQMNLRRTPRLKRGPMGTQQLSKADKENFHLTGYAGNSAPDHVDQLHSLDIYLKNITSYAASNTRSR